MNRQQFDELQRYWQVDRVYTGIKYGWMATYTNRANPAEVWGWQNSRWFFWNGYGWQPTTFRDKTFYGQLMICVAIAFVEFAVAAANSGAATFAMALLGVLTLAIGFILFLLQNYAPRAYEIASVAIAGYWGARALRAFFRG